MLYISGHQALNLPCSLETCGDWHTSALQWDKLDLRESDNSIFGDYGIEKCECIPFNSGEYNIANTIRAALDLMVDSNFGIIQGLKRDFICNDKYTNELFDKVKMLKNSSNWLEIDKFMTLEYLQEWLEYKDKNNIEQIEELINTERNSLSADMELNINDEFILKLIDFNRRCDIRDIYDICLMYKKYAEHLKSDTIVLLQNALAYKGLDYVDYILRTQSDPLIDKEKIANDFLDIMNSLDLI